LVGTKHADVNVGQRDDDSASQRGGVNQMSGSELLGVMYSIREDQAALSIGVQNFDGLARHGGLNVAGFLSFAAGHIFRSRNNADYFHRGL
jgi:hypothetical protein